MPELPEVETIRQGLAENLVGSQIHAVKLRRRDLRVPIPRQLARAVVGQQVDKIRRRAKYLLFDIGEHTLISHLGMTGSWTFNESNVRRKHDHVSFHLMDGRELVFNDPRRFGLLTIVPRGSEGNCSWLSHLGVEPLGVDFDAEKLRALSSGRSIPVKNFLMDQKIVVGIGNIYASEILYRARVRPLRRVERISMKDWRAIATSVREILRAAIGGGGTTLRDYRSVNGQSGRFKNRLQVYGRAKLPCYACSTVIQSRALAGRSTYWCQVCQK